MSEEARPPASATTPAGAPSAEGVGSSAKGRDLNLFVVAGEHSGAERDLPLEHASLDLLRPHAGLHRGDLRERNRGRLAGARIDVLAQHRNARHVLGRYTHGVRIHHDHVVRVAVRVLPARGALPLEERLQRGGDAVDAESRRPRLLRSTRTSSCGISPSSLELGSATPGTSRMVSMTCSAASLRRVGSGPCTKMRIGWP